MLSGWFQTQKLWSACTPRTWISRSTRNRILPIQKGGKLPGTNQCLFLWVSKLPGGATLSANQYFGQCVMPAILGSNAIFTSRWLKQDSPLNTGHYSAGGWASLRARHCEIQKTGKKNQHTEPSQNLSPFVDANDFQISPSKLIHSTFPWVFAFEADSPCRWNG